MPDSHFTSAILQWYAANGRDLPWRRTRDPYAIWLSEIILQQTRIAQGQAYWERFMARFPDVESLAAASEDEVLRLWEGLGYYSRARNLHAAARQIAALGAFPDTLEGIKALKGIGDYTAAAIASIAFGIPAAVVDGNVYRVLARYFGISTPVGTTAAKKEFTALAQSLLPAERPGDFNQALMDFGAMQCTPTSPVCLTCPLAGNCEALRSGRTNLLPVRSKTAPARIRRFHYVYIRCQGETAIRRRGPGDIWQGLWEPYQEEDSVPDFPGMELLKKGVRHQLTHQTLLADFYLLTCEAKPALPEGYIWIPEDKLDRYAKPRLFELLLRALKTHYNSSSS
ncbi:MAG: A/G-specific adenine glycosylase [Bacteroidales bacterium]|nr:A/G-specific adenine glycosylase [Bacteroidales bacterium]